MRTLIGKAWNLRDWKKFKQVSWRNNERVVDEWLVRGYI